MRKGGPCFLLSYEFVLVQSFDDDRDALADADAHGAQGVAGPFADPVAALQFVQCRGHQPGAAHAQRMAQGNGTAIGVDVGGVVRESQFTENGHRWGRQEHLELSTDHSAPVNATLTAGEHHGAYEHRNACERSS